MQDIIISNDLRLPCDLKIIWKEWGISFHFKRSLVFSQKTFKTAFQSIATHKITSPYHFTSMLWILKLWLKDTDWPDPNYRLHWLYPCPLRLSFCLYLHQCHYCVEENTYWHHNHLWKAARIHCYYQWIPKVNCYGVISDPDKESKVRRK